MKGGPGGPAAADGGNQFPPIEALPLDDQGSESLEPAPGDAMSRLADRMAASGEAGSTSLGMLTMIERAEAMGARATVRSSPGAGTTIVVEIDA